MKKIRKVSVLSAVYNEEKYIEEMIRSVLAQTLEDFELLFCDDGSTDNTVKIIREFALLDERVKLVHSNGKIGKVKAFNMAFAASKGETIVLLGGDDIITVDSLKIRYDLISNNLTSHHEKIAAYFKLITFSEDKKYDQLIIPRGEKGNRSGGTVIMTRALAARLFPIDERLATEDVWLSALTKYTADRILDSDKIILKYRIHVGNSNPRHQPFDKANEALHRRLLTYNFILESQGNQLGKLAIEELSILSELENKRFKKDLIGILMSKTDTRSRIFFALHSNKHLYNFRQKFFAFFSGR